MAEPLPDLTIVVPTYNRAHLVRRAVDSCLSDTSQNVEVVIVDDGSTDETAQSLSAVRDARLMVVRQSDNRGACAARRLGVLHARAPWIAFLDSDDELAPGAAGEIIPLLRDIPPDVGTVYTRRRHDNGRISPSHIKAFGRVSYVDYIELISSNYRANCDVFTCIRRSALAPANWPEERVPEIGFHLDLARATGTMLLPDIFYLSHADAIDRLTNPASRTVSCERDLTASRYCRKILLEHGAALRAHGPILWTAIAQKSIVLSLRHGRRSDAFETLRIARAQGGFVPRLIGIFALGRLGLIGAVRLAAARRNWKRAWDL